MMALFSQEYAVDRYVEEKQAESRAEGKAEGKAEGRAEGRAAEKKEVALNMQKRGFPIQTIAEILNVKISEVETWFAEEPPGALPLPQ